MSGHSRWANIKRKKAKGDAAKANVFTKIGRELAVAVKTGGPDPMSNSKLRDVIAKAKAANIPSDNITRNIKKASGELGQINYESITYEGYGPAGSAVLVECLTDNKNRSAGDIRHCFDKYGGSMGTTGCVSYLFETRGVILLERDINANSDADDEMTMLALDNGADDFNADGEVYEIICNPAQTSALREILEKEGKKIISAENEKIPVNKVVPTGDNLENFLKLLDKLDDLDDVQEVFHNAELPEEEE